MYCGDGDFDGQRAAEEIEDVGAMDGTAVQEAVCSETYAGLISPVWERVLSAKLRKAA